jgi:hypothetical protein
MRGRLSAFLMFVVAMSVVTSCRHDDKPTLSAVDRQRLNHAMTYFLYSQANVRLARMPIGRFPRVNDFVARGWVLRGLQQPAQVVMQEKGGLHVSFRTDISVGGDWEKLYTDNPKAPLADLLVQLFRDAPSAWDPRERLWHLGQVYKDDYEWARNEDRFKLPLAFYQDPYPETCQ